MGRWEHEVHVAPSGPRGYVALLCSCGWRGRPVSRPTVSRLTEIAREHRRERETP